MKRVSDFVARSQEYLIAGLVRIIDVKRTISRSLSSPCRVSQKSNEHDFQAEIKLNQCHRSRSHV